MPPEVLDPPVSQPDLAQSIFNPNPDGGGKPPASTPESSAAAPPDGGQKLESAPPPNEPPKKKGGLDKVGAIKKPEVATPPPAGKPGDSPPGGSKEENMKLLRQAAEEWGKVKPEYEKTKTEYEAAKQELAKLKAMGLSPQEREEFTRYRDLHAVEAVRTSDKFVKNILEPIKYQVAKIESVAKNAKLNDSQKSALMDACDIPDGFQRNKAIKAALQGAELELDDFQLLTEEAIGAARELNENLYPKEDSILAQAQQIEASRRQADAQQMTASQQKRQQEFQKEHQRVFDILANDKLKVILDDPDNAIDGITMQEAMKGASEPQSMEDFVFAIHAASAIPFIINWGNKLLAKNIELEEANRVRNGSAPRRADGGPPKETPIGEQKLTAEEVFGGRR